MKVLTKHLKYFIDLQNWAENTPSVILRMKIDEFGIVIKVNIKDEFELLLKDVKCFRTAYLKILNRYNEYRKCL